MKPTDARAAMALIAAAALLATSGLTLAPQPATAQGELFRDASRPADPLPGIDRKVVRARYVDVNFALLDGTAGPPSDVHLNLFRAGSQLFPEVSLAATRTRVGRTRSGQGTVWTGHVPGDSLSQVLMVVENGVLAADIRAQGRLYQVRYRGGGIHAIYEVNPAAFPPDEDVRPSTAARSAAMAAQSAAPPPSGSGTAAAPIAAVDDGSTIDFMVLYTPAAASEAGGEAGINSEINLAIETTNAAYMNSGVNFRARLVYVDQALYTETGNMGTDLHALTGGTMAGRSGQTVASLRNQFGADIVSLFVRENFTACGIGLVMYTTDPAPDSEAFNVVDRTCATSNYSLAHESGHNMGLCHDWIQNDCTPQIKWAHGYVDPENRFRDIMSYPQSCVQPNGSTCPRVQYFSNLVTTFQYQGQNLPIGASHTAAQPADNAAVLNTNASVVANFRQCVAAPCGAGGATATPTAIPPPGATPTSTPSSATPSPTAPPGATPTSAPKCDPRPSIAVDAVRTGPNSLQVTISATDASPTAARLQQLQIGGASNALIDVGGLTGVTGNRTINLPPETLRTTFTVHHAQVGQSTTVPFTVVDGCGAWPTFVGGGAEAF